MLIVTGAILFILINKLIYLLIKHLSGWHYFENNVKFSYQREKRFHFTLLKSFEILQDEQ